MNKATIETLQQRLEELTEAGRNYLENDELQQQILNLKSESEALIRKHPLASNRCRTGRWIPDWPPFEPRLTPKSCPIITNISWIESAGCLRI
jgi:FtsZ-binding cell division protein ZapB